MGVFLAGGVLVAVGCILYFKFSGRKKVRIAIPGGRVRSGGAPSLIIEQIASGHKILIEKSPHLEFYAVKVPLFLSNPMSCEAVITKIFWTVWFSNLVHSGVSTKEIIVPPQATHFEVKLSDVVEDKLFGALWEISKLAASGVQGFLEGKLFFRIPSGHSSRRIFSQVFSYCGFALETRGSLADKGKGAVVFSKDPLTGLLTRQFLDTQCQSLIDSFVPSHVLSVLILDVDDFKSINDKYGHLIGDEVLKLLAKGIETVMKPDDFAIRYGGDEFVILLQDQGAQEAEKFSNELRTAVSMLSLTLEAGQRLNFTISIGLAVINTRAPYREWIRLADDVLRLAKRQGKNRLVINRRAPEVTF